MLYGALTVLAGRTAGVEVTRNGVIARPYWGPRRFVPWEDAHLLEVSGTQMDPVFRLYGTRAVARWSNQAMALPVRYPTRISVSRAFGSQGNDVAGHFKAICAAIVTHAGLVPCSFSHDLLTWYGHPPATPRKSGRRRWPVPRRFRAQQAELPHPHA